MLKVCAPLVLLAVLLGAATLADRPLPRADFVAVNNGDVSTLDFTQMSWLQDFRAARLLFEGLTRTDVFSRAYRLEPAAAERWEVSADFRTFTFHLRPDATWSDGAPVKAQDFRYAWMRMLLPEHGADYVKLFRLITGAQGFYDRRVTALKRFASMTGSNDDRRRAAEALWRETAADFDANVGLRAVDDRTLVVELAKPTPYFLSLTAFPAFYPLPRHSLERRESVDPATAQMRTDPAWFKPGSLIGNGPFILESWSFKREMRFRKNSSYYAAAGVALDTIAMPTIDNGNAAVMAFATGAVDWVSDVTTGYRGEMLAAKADYYREHETEYRALASEGVDPVEIDRRLPADPRQNIHAFPAFGTYFYNFNCRARLADGRVNPFADARVRRAFTMALDKRALVDTVRRSGEPAATSLIPPGSIDGYEPPKGLGFDAVRAAGLLAEAGYPGGKDFPTVELLFNSDGGHELIAAWAGKCWEEYLGVSVALSQKEVRVFREQVKSGNFMVSRGTWFGDYGDPTTFLDISREGDGNNDRGYADAEYESLMTKAETEADPGARLGILQRAERVLMERDVPMAPIFHYVQVYLFDPHRITGISPHPRQEQCLYLVDVLGDGKGSDRARVMGE